MNKIKLLDSNSMSVGTYLAVEDYCKWYNIYLVVNGKETKVPEDLYLNLDLWRDHCLAPKGFVELAKSLNAKVLCTTYGRVCDRFRRDCLEVREHHYIPEQDCPSEDLLKHILVDND